jgi:uncharacterized membrane protein HdeD (DUF308 family)
MNLMLIGAIAMASLTAGLFFLRFWRDTQDSFFLFFAASFLLEAANRVALGLSRDPNEASPLFYFVRLLSFVLILVAIAYKNRAKKAARRASPV